MKRFTDEEIQYLLETFPSSECLKHNCDYDWHFCDDYSIFFYKYNAFVELELCSYHEIYGFEALKRIKIALTGDLEEDLRFGIRQVLNATE